MTVAALIVAALAGPVGIVLGWFLNERSETARANRALEAQERREEAERVTAVVRDARAAAAGFRGLAHGTHLGVSGDQFEAEAAKFNDAWHGIELGLAMAAVRGPDWLEKPGNAILITGRDGMATMTRLQRAVTRADSELVQQQIADLDAAVEQLILVARQNLRPGADPISALPSAKPDADG